MNDSARSACGILDTLRRELKEICDALRHGLGRWKIRKNQVGLIPGRRMTGRGRNSWEFGGHNT